MRVSMWMPALAMGAALLGGPATAGEIRLPEKQSPFMRVFGPAQPPYGAVQFCDETPDECRRGAVEDSRVPTSPDKLAELDEINRLVNRTVQPVTDIDHYGVNEYWTIPKDGKGDCEDYALLKRHLLMTRGWPAGALLMTVVRDEHGEGHAVLTARMTQGDLVLDNKVDDVRAWSATPYSFVMRQSYLDPRAWISLDPSDQIAPPAIAGMKPRR
jgi:predicted transglutaminase-like cysteine proteinase